VTCAGRKSHGMPRASELSKRMEKVRPPALAATALELLLLLRGHASSILSATSAVNSAKR
jgi:hypothetical protein